MVLENVARSWSITVVSIAFIIWLFSAIFWIQIDSINGIEYWESSATKYDNVISLLFRYPMKQVISSTKTTVRDKNVLEIACGTGIVTIQIASTAKNIIATDYSDNMLNELQQKLDKNININNVIVSKQDLYNIDLNDYNIDEFDVIIAANILHLLNDIEKGLKSMQKYLKNDGILIIPTYCHSENIIAQFMSYLLQTISNFPLETSFTSQKLEKILQQNGWNVIKKEVYFGLIPIAYIEATRQGVRS